MAYKEIMTMKEIMIYFSTIQNINNLLSKFNYQKITALIYAYDKDFFIKHPDESKTKTSLFNFIFHDNNIDNKFYETVMLKYFKQANATIGKLIYQDVLDCDLWDRTKIKKQVPNYNRLDNVLLMMYYQKNRPGLELEHIAAQNMQSYIQKGSFTK